MTSKSLVAAVAPRTGKIIKSVFERGDGICYKMVYYALYLG